MSLTNSLAPETDEYRGLSRGKGLSSLTDLISVSRRWWQAISSKGLCLIQKSICQKVDSPRITVWTQNSSKILKLISNGTVQSWPRTCSVLLGRLLTLPLSSCSLGSSLKKEGSWRRARRSSQYMWFTFFARGSILNPKLLWLQLQKRLRRLAKLDATLDLRLEISYRSLICFMRWSCPVETMRAI